MTALVILLALLCANPAQTAEQDSWSEHWDSDWEVSFLYPSDWRLFTAQDPGPYGYFRMNQLAICTRADQPEVGFNVSAILGAPPQPFAAKMEASLQGTTQKLGGTRLSFRALTVSDCEAVELRHRLSKGAGTVVQKIVAIAAPKNGFIVTCTAPEAEFAALERDVFSTVIDRFMIGEPTRTAFWRQVWSHTPRPWRGVVVGIALASAACFAWFVLRRRAWEMG
jgi:hypothetical protein